MTDNENEMAKTETKTKTRSDHARQDETIRDEAHEARDPPAVSSCAASRREASDRLELGRSQFGSAYR